jgi:hypothetical protein
MFKLLSRINFFFYRFSAFFLAIALCLMMLFADGLRRIATILVHLDGYRSRGRIQAAIRTEKNNEMRLEFLSGDDSSFHSLDPAVSTSS